MTFISSAQNGEDVVLWRALQDVTGGRYIDAGAADPTIDSVTHAFYQRGWQGINIEPEPELHARLAAARPLDINLQVGLGEQPGEAEFFLVGCRSGLSTFDSTIASTHSGAGFTSRRISIPVRTLAQVCEEHANGPIHFLKIDVEGSEQAVIQGADFARWRPWIVLVEATFPNSDRPTYTAWEPLLGEAGYRFTLFDGLNRFYVAAEHWNRLHGKLGHSACIRDGYITRREDATINRVAELEQVLREREAATQSHADQLRADIGTQQRNLAEKDAELDGLRTEVTKLSLGTAGRDGMIRSLEAAIVDANGRLVEYERRIAEAGLQISERDKTLASLRETATGLRGELRAEGVRTAALQEQVSSAQRQLTALYASTSWRVTAPLRAARTAWARLARPSRTG